MKNFPFYHIPHTKFFHTKIPSHFHLIHKNPTAKTKQKINTPINVNIGSVITVSLHNKYFAQILNELIKINFTMWYGCKKRYIFDTKTKKIQGEKPHSSNNHIAGFTIITNCELMLP